MAALAAVIQEASSRACRPARLVQAMGMSGVSKSQVADDKVIDRWRAWPYLWLDATYVTRGRAHRLGRGDRPVNDQGRREVLGMAIGASEAGPSDRVPASLARRGLRGVRLLISDDHKGLRAAATRILGARQRCRVHFARNLLAHPAARAGASSPPSSPPPSPRRTPTARRPSGVRSPTSSGPRCPSWQLSWTKPSASSPTCFPKEPARNWPPCRGQGRTNVVHLSQRSRHQRLVGAMSRTMSGPRYMTLESIAPLSDGVPITLRGSLTSRPYPPGAA